MAVPSMIQKMTVAKRKGEPVTPEELQAWATDGWSLVKAWKLDGLSDQGARGMYFILERPK